MSALKSTQPPVTRVVILTAVAREYEAVKGKLLSCKQLLTKSRAYIFGEFKTKNGGLIQVALARIGAGNVGAVLSVVDAITELNPDLVCFLGVAGGIKDVNLGDVVIGSTIYAYERGKSEASRFTVSPEMAHTNTRLVDYCRTVGVGRAWKQRLSKADRAIASASAVYVEPLASGEKVIKSERSEVAKVIHTSFPDAVAVEMEGYGTLFAARHRGCPALVVRGISDMLSDKDKDHDKQWQPRAARHAVSVLFEILSTLNFGWLAGEAPTSPMGDCEQVDKETGVN